MTPVSPYAPSGAIEDPPSVEAIVLMAMPGVERGLRFDERSRAGERGPSDLERAAGSAAEALAAVSATPAVFTILAIGVVLWIVMYRLLIG